MVGKIFTFYLEGELYGIDIRLVKEVNRRIKFTPVPGSQPFIAGLFNMRGQVVTLFDLARKLYETAKGSSGCTTCVILKSTPARPDYIGFLVDRPGDVVDVEEAWCEPMPASTHLHIGRYLKEIVKMKDQLISIIDADRIFDWENTAQQTLQTGKEPFDYGKEEKK